MQKHVNLVDLVKSFPPNIFLQNLASIQQRTSFIKFHHLDEKSESALRYRTFQLVGRDGAAPGAAAAVPRVDGLRRLARLAPAAGAPLLDLRTPVNNFE